MNRDFQVSVIVPVYNADKFLRKAVESAVELEEVGEVILVEDNSPDNSLVICLELEKDYKKVRLLRHPDKGNHGAGASRNLGIERASSEFIAFLDADDYYLPHRFKKDKEIFLTHPEIDGVYHATGIHYYSEEARKKFLNAGYEYQELTTLTGLVSAEDLFKVQFHQHPSVKGEFTTDAITLRKSVFSKTGTFNTELRLLQDIHLWKRLSASCILAPGVITEPVAIRGVHGENRMTNKQENNKYNHLFWESLKKEFREKRLEINKYRIFEKSYYGYLISSSNKMKALIFLLYYFIKYPAILRETYSFFDLNFLKIFGHNWVTLHFLSFKNRLIGHIQNRNNPV